MKIGILYICTGKYDIFWKDFYLSAEKYLLAGHEIHYFVFTDAEVIFDEEHNSRIHRIFQENLGWPGNTLMRFDMFLRSRQELAEMDHLYFFNANLEIQHPIYSEVFLSKEPLRLVATLHPGYYNKKRRYFPYEQNKQSSAYIQATDGESYFAGGLMGGFTHDFLLACEVIYKNILEDEKKGVVAQWHDESHWNAYLIGRKDIHTLPSSYLYPGRAKLDLEKIIIIRDKRDMPGFGDYYYQQGRSLGLFTKILSFFGK